MKILFISDYHHICKPTSELQLSDIRNTSTLYAYYLRKLCQKKGITTTYCRTGVSTHSSNYQEFWQDKNKYWPFITNNQREIEECCHAICLEQRGFALRMPIFFKEIKKICRGTVNTISDNCGVIGPENNLFYAVPNSDKQVSLRHKERMVYTGWGADPDLCYPQKNNNTLNILIDHSYYGSDDETPPDFDKTNEIIKNTCEFVKKYKKMQVKPSLGAFWINDNSNNNTNINKTDEMDLLPSKEQIHIRRFVSDGVETLDIENPWVDVYNRKGLNYPDACAEYRKADIFIVTHKESLGFSVIESAMSGALIVSPQNFIQSSLLKDLNHLEYEEDKIPWAKVLAKINFEKSREMAREFTWEKIFDKMLKKINLDTTNIIKKYSKQISDLSQIRLDDMGETNSGLYGYYTGKLKKGYILNKDDLYIVRYIYENYPRNTKIVELAAGCGQSSHVISCLGYEDVSAIEWDKTRFAYGEYLQKGLNNQVKMLNKDFRHLPLHQYDLIFTVNAAGSDLGNDFPEEYKFYKNILLQGQQTQLIMKKGSYGVRRENLDDSLIIYMIHQIDTEDCQILEYHNLDRNMIMFKKRDLHRNLIAFPDFSRGWHTFFPQFFQEIKIDSQTNQNYNVLKIEHKDRGDTDDLSVHQSMGIGIMLNTELLSGLLTQEKENKNKNKNEMETQLKLSVWAKADNEDTVNKKLKWFTGKNWLKYNKGLTENWDYYEILVPLSDFDFKQTAKIRLGMMNTDFDLTYSIHSPKWEKTME